jgi:hypothetical protein
MRTLVTGQHAYEAERNAGLNPQPSTLNLQPSIFNLQPQPSTLNPQTGLQNVDLACRVSLEAFRPPLQPVQTPPHKNED